MVAWYIVGVVFMAMELMVISGVGFMFAALGAITVGAALNFNILAVDATLSHFALFFAAIAFWAVLLWKPMQKFAVGKNKQTYHNMIGHIAIVGDAGVTKLGGEVKWSGTLMKAKLAENCEVESVVGGAQVLIKEINGNTLTVTPK